MDFVRNKVVNDMIKAFMQATMLSMKRGVFVPKEAVKYSRGKLKVDGILIVSENLIDNPDFSFYRRLFALYWDISVPFKLLKRQLHFVRKLFGPNVLSNNVIKPQDFLLREIICRMVTGKSYSRIKPIRRHQFAQHFFGKDYIVLELLNHHPMGSVLLQWFRALKNFRDYLYSRQGNVISWNMWTYKPTELLSKIPSFNLELLGDKRLTKRQLAALYGRKFRMEKVILWTLLFDTKAIVKELFITPSLCLVVRFSLQGLFVYVKDTTVTVSGNGSIRFRFRVPSLVAAFQGLPTFKTPNIKASLMPGRLLQIRKFLTDPAYFSKPIKQVTIDKWLKAFMPSKKG